MPLQGNSFICSDLVITDDTSESHAVRDAPDRHICRGENKSIGLRIREPRPPQVTHLWRPLSFANITANALRLPHRALHTPSGDWKRKHHRFRPSRGHRQTEEERNHTGRSDTSTKRDLQQAAEAATGAAATLARFLPRPPSHPLHHPRKQNHQPQPNRRACQTKRK